MHTVKLMSPSPLELADSIVLEGDVQLALSRLPSESVQCVVPSPPYWGLRDYGIAGQIGLEPTLAGFIQALTNVFSEVKRVLRSDGILWLNIGDGYTSGNRGWRAPDKKNPNRAMNVRPDNPPGLKDKDLLGIPWRLALALQDNGWFLRSDIVWHKPNVMPESVKDRPTRAHEYLFMLTKTESYHYDQEAVKEPTENGHTQSAHRLEHQYMQFRQFAYRFLSTGTGRTVCAGLDPSRRFRARPVLRLRNGGDRGPTIGTALRRHRIEPGLCG